MGESRTSRISLSIAETRNCLICRSTILIGPRYKSSYPRSLRKKGFRPASEIRAFRTNILINFAQTLKTFGQILAVCHDVRLQLSQNDKPSS